MKYCIDFHFVRYTYKFIKHIHTNHLPIFINFIIINNVMIIIITLLPS